MSPEPLVSRAKAPPAKRSEKGYGDENELLHVVCFVFFMQLNINSLLSRFPAVMAIDRLVDLWLVFSR